MSIDSERQETGDMNGDKNQNFNDKNNSNHEMLNFNDNYALILQKLANDNSHILNQDLSPHAMGSGPMTFGGEKQHSENSGNTGDKQNLDALLQHYQSLLTRSATAQYPGSSAGTSLGDNHNSSNNNKQENASNGNHSHNSNKSTITERPCDHCRRRQTKCVLVPDLADCIQCETKGIKCTFSDMPNNVNRFSGSNDMPNGSSKHPRQETGIDLEGLLKRAKTSNNDNVAQYYAELLQNLNDSMNNNNNNNVHGGFNINSSGSAVSPATVPNNGRVMNVMPPQNAPPSQRQPYHTQPSGQYPRSSLYVGATSVYDLNLVNHVKLDNIDQIQLSPSVSLRKVAPDVLFVLRDNFNEQVFLKQEQEVDMVERLIYPHGKVLIDIFFKLIHPCFPILHERVFLEKYARSYRELTAPLLASIYSLSIQWWDFHPKLIGFPKPDVVNQLNEIAYRTFFQMIERPKLSIVQTGLLMLQCRSECPNNWVLCSALVALCEELGLGVDCQDWRLPRWERGLRRRLAWAVWVQEKWTALIESRNSHLILGRNWMVKMLSEEDFPQNSPVISGSQDSISKSSSGSENPLGNISLIDMSPTDEDFLSGNLMFQQLVSLSVILGEIMDTFYTEGAVKVTTKIEQVLKLAKPLQLKLREWYHSLPSQLSMNKFVPRKFNPNATLTLAYFAAEITLHRKIISTLKQDTPKELVQVCRTAAKTRLVAAIEFVRDLKSEHINAFWYTCSTGNLMLIAIFAALLYVTAQNRDEAIIVRDYLRNYIWILRVASKSFDRSGTALKRIHILLSQIPGLLTDEHPKEFIPTRSQSPMYPPQHWKMSSMMSVPSSMDSQQMSPNLNQLRNIPAELLQTLAGMQGSSPKFSVSRSTAQSSPTNMGGEVNANASSPNYSGGNDSETAIKANLERTNIFPKSNHESGGTEQPTPDPLIESSGASNAEKKDMSDQTAINQNPKGKPITPQSVGGANVTKDSTPTAKSEAPDNSTNTSGSSVSPTSMQDKEEQSGNSNEPDLNHNSPEQGSSEEKDDQKSS